VGRERDALSAQTLIQLWSGPRNISTALMYSFAQRDDTRVVDEPLYAHYLRVSGARHPGRDQVLAAQDNDGRRVIDAMLGDDFGRPTVFFKQMTHHLVEFDDDDLLRLLGDVRTRNVLLVRDPRAVLISYSKVIEQPTLDDIGIRRSFELYQWLAEEHLPCLVLDSADVLRNPSGTLAALCAALELPFDDAMLHWQAGARPEDGVWAKHWYGHVHRSTGFAAGNAGGGELSAELAALYDEARPYYDFLAQHALKAA
jgi:hypothetical protein